MDNENKKGKNLVRVTIIVTVLLTFIFWIVEYFVIYKIYRIFYI
ncbi:hypothetical protein [Johnsonella ignava]|nr:hypothetical protein [Johnsonella ignava]